MKPFTICEAEQRSALWFAARAGRVTASRADAVLAFSKKDGAELAARRDYRMQLALERILGKPLEDGNGFQNADMKRGVELEPDAFALYEAVRGLVVRRTGFLAHDEMPIGVSPDGDVDDCLGLVELKCPRPANHFAYWTAGVVPSDYMPQILHGQLVTGAQWTDFVSFCPDFPSEPVDLRLFVVRIERDEKAIHAYRIILNGFLKEVEAKVEDVRALMRARVA